MTKTIANDIQELILKAAGDKIFTADALERMQAIARESIKLETELEEERKDHADLKVDHGILLARQAKFDEKKKGLDVREDLLSEREKGADLLKAAVESESMRVQDHKEMVGLIFRNAEFKRSMFGSTAPHWDDPTNYGSPKTVPVSEDVTTKQE